MDGCGAGRLKSGTGPVELSRSIAKVFWRKRRHVGCKWRAFGSIRADFTAAQLPDLEKRDEFLTSGDAKAMKMSATNVFDVKMDRVVKVNL